MKKLKFVSRFEQVVGNVIEHNSSGYYLKSYEFTEEGEFQERKIDSKHVLTAKEEDDVIMQKSFKKRIKRLHYYFKAAEYISENVIYMLSPVDEDDDFEDLREVVEF